MPYYINALEPTDTTILGLTISAGLIVGLYTTGFTFAQTLAVVPVAWAGDRFDKRSVLLVVLGIGVVVYGLFPIVDSSVLFHVVVSATEAMFLISRGQLALATGAFDFVLPVLLGNTIGGVLLVTVVNYFQAVERKYQAQNYQLSMRELLFGKYVGSDYAPSKHSDDR